MTQANGSCHGGESILSHFQAAEHSCLGANTKNDPTYALRGILSALIKIQSSNTISQCPKSQSHDVTRRLDLALIYTVEHLDMLTLLVDGVQYKSFLRYYMASAGRIRASHQCNERVQHIYNVPTTRFPV